MPEVVFLNLFNMTEAQQKAFYKQHTSYFNRTLTDVFVPNSFSLWKCIVNQKTAKGFVWSVKIPHGKEIRYRLWVMFAYSIEDRLYKHVTCDHK